MYFGSAFPEDVVGITRHHVFDNAHPQANIFVQTELLFVPLTSVDCTGRVGVEPTTPRFLSPILPSELPPMQSKHKTPFDLYVPGFSPGAPTDYESGAP